MKIYGIKNCDTVKKAKKWLDDNDVSYDFYDFKKTAPDADLLAKWVDELGWEILVNKRGTTYRKLSDTQKNNITDSKSAISVMLDNSSIIKRPILFNGKKHIVGFNEEEYKGLVANL